MGVTFRKKFGPFWLSPRGASIKIGPFSFSRRRQVRASASVAGVRWWRRLR
jgi:hypothetical protein